MDAARGQADQGPLDLRVDTYPERWRLLNRLAEAYIVRALRALGLFTSAGERHTPEQLIDRFAVQPTYRHLLGRWLGGLSDSGLLRRDGDEGFVAETPLAEPQLDELLLATGAKLADSAPLLEYLRRCGEHLAAVLRGSESALATLFPDGSYETVDYLYSQWAVARYFNAIVRAAAVAAAQARPTRQLRVLEVGAGTGGTTAALLPALAADHTSYTFTDVSEFFLARAAERFASYPFVRYAICNIEQPPEAQGFAVNGYDLVIASNVLHATRDLDATLRHVRALIAPGGALVLYETTSHPLWFDISTGLIEGWQRFEDSWRGDHPLLPPERWAAALEAAGFAEVLALPGNEQPTAILGQHVILARAPGESAAAAPGSLTSELGAAWPVAPQAAEAVSTLDVLTAALAEALPDERHELLVEFVRGAIAKVLRLSDSARLRRDQPLLDLGFDSLMAVELRNVLRQGLHDGAQAARHFGIRLSQHRRDSRLP